jgi:N-acetylated-alpha-linked acidic dipeptidase
MSETTRTAARRRLADSYDAKALSDAIRDFIEEAARADSRRREAVMELESARPASNEARRATERLRRINDALLNTERALTDARGLNGRPWYKHQIYAPGYYTGYAAQPLPDLRRAIDDRNGANAREAAARITAAIRRAIEALAKARD